MTFPRKIRASDAVYIDGRFFHVGERRIADQGGRGEDILVLERVRLSDSVSTIERCWITASELDAYAASGRAVLLSLPPMAPPANERPVAPAPSGGTSPACAAVLREAALA